LPNPRPHSQWANSAANFVPIVAQYTGYYVLGHCGFSGVAGVDRTPLKAYH